MARHFERGASSFRAFVESVEADAEEGSVDEAPIVEEGTEGVRVMTVYKAKGLEFPVVILADPTYKTVRSEPSRHIDASCSLWLEPLCGAAPIELREASDLESRRDQAEAIRVAYVAATRARDLLVVPTCGDAPIEGWYGVLDPMLYPAENARRSSGAAPGCPPFGEDSVLERGPKGQTPLAGSVRPGLHTPSPNGAPVVWWDPAVLRLDVDELAPLRHQRLLEPGADGAAAAESQRGYEAWKTGRAALLADASRPAISVQTVTASVRSAAARAQTGLAASPGEPGVQVERMDRDQPDRPGGRRFGALVHALLASIDLRADAGSIQAMASVHGRIVGATDEEVAAAITTIGRVLAHPILRRAGGMADHGAVRRETPILLTLEDGRLLEGVVDLAFRDDEPGFGGWTVVDFKTNREVEGSLEAYAAQVQVYSRAVATATGSPARGILLVI
jgi:ATP-dependent exoDNAse (exonuclease V) beta subunit